MKFEDRIMASGNQSVAVRARRRIMQRILPYLFLLYIIAFIDRVNVGYATLKMSGDLGFSSEVYGFGAGIFFIGYFLLEIPGSLIVEKWSARRWIARIMISWGLLAVMMGFMNTAKQFYVLRFLLGAAEAGFFPGIIVYLSHWFLYEDRAKAVALFMAAIPISSIIGSPVSGLILGVHWFGLEGWRWLFIIEGAPAIFFGVVTLFYLTDWPSQAKWLLPDEREWITTELEKEKQFKLQVHAFRIAEAFRQREVIFLTLGYFLAVTSGYGLIFWLPTFVKSISGSSDFKVSLISAMPYCVALVSMLLTGWSSDRTRERRWHTTLPMIATSVGFLLSAILQGHPVLAVAMFCLVAAGVHSYLPSFWSLPTKFLTGTAAAASIGLINSVGNLGGFLGPYVVGYINTATNSFFGGILFLSLSALMGAIVILSLRHARQEPVVVVPSRSAL
jgi:MFS transporter, ACS family, tartrate transporter